MDGFAWHTVACTDNMVKKEKPTYSLFTPSINQKPMVPAFLIYHTMFFNFSHANLNQLKEDANQINLS